MHDERLTRVGDKFGVSLGDIAVALSMLDGSFVYQRPEGEHRVWTFAHPTIADALAELLRDRPDLLELYLLGAKADELFGEVVCEGMGSYRDAILVPKAAEDLLLARLRELPDEESTNKILFSFLAKRASDFIVTQTRQLFPDLLDRRTGFHWRIYFDGRLQFLGRLQAMGLLPPAHREEAADALERALFDRTDASLLSEEQAMGLIPANRLMSIAIRLYRSLGDGVLRQIKETVEQADLSGEPADNFDDLKTYLSEVSSAFFDIDDVQEALGQLEKPIELAIASIAAKKEAADSPEWDGEDVAPKVTAPSNSSRSIFNDMDR